MDSTFLSQFEFRPELRFHVGVEREFFLVGTHTGMPLPYARAFLSLVRSPAWTYELSACQVEHRTAPCRNIDALMRDLKSGQNAGTFAARQLGCHLIGASVAPETMPLDVYPNPRYARISATLPEHVLSAACRVAGTHVHVGVADINEAVAVHDALVQEMDELINLGDLSEGRRMALYAVMAPSWRPPLYHDADGFHEHAVNAGYVASPRDCWHLIRISVHGTVEVRAFGATSDRRMVKRWAKRVLDIAHGALA